MPTMAAASRPVRGSRRSFREESGGAREQVLAHQSVMVGEVVRLLRLRAGDIVVDATWGTGGHSKALRRARRVRLVAIDEDPRAAGVIRGNFADLKQLLAAEGITKIDKALFDLGWNREQLHAGRGFSFQRNEPLDMRYGRTARSGFTAREILNGWSEKALADVFFGYGEERYARRIAKAVAVRRALAPIETTLELVEIVNDAVPPRYRHGRIHPATKTFQALRVAVNDELRALAEGLEAAWTLLNCDGRIAVISFHSVEDRIVKNRFKRFVREGGVLVVKKPLTPGAAEVKQNPSSRSAKLRVIEKICAH
jgi:16S rRNA (cytosine1402-N4)-methyltransferase